MDGKDKHPPRLKMGFIRDMFRDAGKESLGVGSRPVDLGKRHRAFTGYALRVTTGRFHGIQLHENKLYELRRGDRVVWNVTAAYLDQRLRAMVAQNAPESSVSEAERIQAILSEFGFPHGSVTT